MHMEIRVLRYFLAVAAEESITRAAQILHITQPTLSRQLADLESELGVQLFYRGSRKIRLTEEGILLRHRAEEIIAIADKTTEDLMSSNTLIKGKIVIGSGELTALQTVLKYTESFRSLYPEVRFELFTGTADVVKERMDTGLIDIGILLEPVNTDSYDCIQLSESEQWCALFRSDDILCNKAYISPDDLIDRQLVVPARQNVQDVVSHWMKTDANKLQISYITNLSGGAAAAVLTSGAIGLVTMGSLNLLNPQILTYRPLKPDLSAGAVIAWPKQVPNSQAVNQFIQHLTCSIGISDDNQ